MPTISLKGVFYTLGLKKTVEYMLFVVFLLFFYSPLLNLCMLAFADSYEYPSFLPNALSLKWWKFVFSQGNLLSSMTISFVLAVVVTAASLLICLPAAYAFARFNFPGKHFFQFTYLLTNAFPKVGLYVAIGLVFYRMHLMGTFLGVVLIHIINTIMFMTWLPTNSFSGVPSQQEEAARDVGASPLRVFFYVTLPTALPGIIVASIFTFLGSLEEAQGSLFVGFPDIKTIPVVMYSVIFDYPVSAAAVFSIVLTVPTIILAFIAGRLLGLKTLIDAFKLR
jgi:putative spermidine/putrescine transport system permease protein